jgi:hypothetical protein
MLEMGLGMYNAEYTLPLAGYLENVECRNFPSLRLNIENVYVYRGSGTL